MNTTQVGRPPRKIQMLPKEVLGMQSMDRALPSKSGRQANRFPGIILGGVYFATPFGIWRDIKLHINVNYLLYFR